MINTGLCLNLILSRLWLFYFFFHCSFGRRRACLNTVTGHNRWLDEKHLYFLSVKLGSLNIGHFVVVVGCHSVHRD